ncbi:DUF2569 family protein, partial [Candidatus Eisenbacteria bacterium]
VRMGPWAKPMQPEYWDCLEQYVALRPTPSKDVSLTSEGQVCVCAIGDRSKARACGILPRFRFLQRLITLLLLLATPCETLATYTVSPPPDWIEPAPRMDTTTSPQDHQEGGQLIQLIDNQVNVETQEYYSLVRSAIANESGLQSGSRVTFEFDPVYEELVLHHVGIRRDGEFLDQLESGNIEVIQQESELYRDVLHGHLSVVIFLRDVRVGDVIESCGTLRGWNPILGNRYTNTFVIPASQFVEHRRLRVLFGESHQISRRSHGVVPEPEHRNHAGVTELLWDLKNVPGVKEEGDVPSWYHPFSFVVLSEFENWSSVADWGVRLYPIPAVLDEGLRKEISQWKQQYDSLEEQALAALRFAQEEVRYLGFQMGPGSYEPAPPREVLDRRYGDCKDKALLLCTLYHHLGIEAHPAFVHTAGLHTIEEWLPTPLAFNHVIVQARIGSQTYWVDPTQTHERGILSRRPVPQYRRALVVHPGATALSEIQDVGGAGSRIHVEERFKVAQYDSTVILDVQTIYEGRNANELRRALAHTDGDEYESNCLNFYAGTYPQIELLQPFQIDDDEDQNRISVSEHYAIEDFWRQQEAQGLHECEIVAHNISSALYYPSAKLRTMPLAVFHPVVRTHTVEIEMPEAWDLEDYNGQRIRLDYILRSKSDSVEPEKVPSYLADLDRIDRTLSFILYVDPEFTGDAASMNWGVLLAGSLWGLLLAIAAVAYNRRTKRTLPPIDPADGSHHSPDIRGWLILVAIGVVIRPFYIVFVMFSDLTAYSAESWAVLCTPGGAGYHPLWEPILIMELLGQIAFLILSVLILLLFFKKRRALPRVFIASLIATLVFSGMDHVLGEMIPAVAQDAGNDSMKQLVRAVIQAAVWAPYFSVSKRVKATFVH